MRNLGFVLAVLAIGLGAASVMVQGPLPLDIEISQWLQQAIPARAPWIGLVSATAGWPWIVVSGLAVAALSSLVAGMRGGGTALIAMAGAMAMERVLRLVISVPRPSAELVDVAKASASSGLPSTFAIFHGAACGALILLSFGNRKREAFAIRIAATALLIVGCTGRIAAGGHWTSQAVASAAMGGLASVLAVRLFRLGRV